MDEMLVDDEGRVRVVMDRGNLHHRRALDRGHTAPRGEKALARRAIVRQQELDGDDLTLGLVERPPDLGLAVAAVEDREAVPRHDEVALFEGRPRLRLHRGCAVHRFDNGMVRSFSSGWEPTRPVRRY